MIAKFRHNYYKTNIFYKLSNIKILTYLKKDAQRNEFNRE